MDQNMLKRISGIIVLVLMSNCSLSKKTYYILPPEMTESVRKSAEEQCEKGLMLFRMNCSKCHADTVNGKEILPDFTPEQLSNYEFRVANKKHEDNLGEMQLTQDELVSIIAFLTYKKKNKA